MRRGKRLLLWSGLTLGLVGAGFVFASVGAKVLCRARWQRILMTQGAIRQVTLRLEMHVLAAGSYPAMSRGPITRLETVLAPYTSSHPLQLDDGWGHPLLYESDGKHYEVRATGRDGLVDAVVLETPTSWDHDMVFADGTWTTIWGTTSARVHPLHCR